MVDHITKNPNELSKINDYSITSSTQPITDGSGSQQKEFKPNSVKSKLLNFNNKKSLQNYSLAAPNNEDDDQELKNMDEKVHDQNSQLSCKHFHKHFDDDDQDESDHEIDELNSRRKQGSKNRTQENQCGQTTSFPAHGSIMKDIRSQQQDCLEMRTLLSQRVRQEEQNEDEEEEDEDEDEEETSPEAQDDENDPEKSSLAKSFRRIQGVVPKDIDLKKEMMSFIAYGQNLEGTCKLLTYSKVINFSEGHNDKNRMYLSGTSIMSTKLNVGLVHSKKLCEQLRNQEIIQRQIRRSNFLEKHLRQHVTNKMKGYLTQVQEMQNKYIDLNEYKKYLCINIDAAIPEIKVADEDDLSDTKLEQIKINRRKRRRYKNSFYNADNLVQWTEEDLNIEEYRMYDHQTITYFELRDRKNVLQALANLVKPESNQNNNTGQFYNNDKSRLLGYNYSTNGGTPGFSGAGINIQGVSSYNNSNPDAPGFYNNQIVQSRYLNSINDSSKNNSNKRKASQFNNVLGNYGQGGAAGPGAGAGASMDILKKFRYNFHYWLRNCYQAEDIADNQNYQYQQVQRSSANPGGQPTKYPSTAQTSHHPNPPQYSQNMPPNMKQKLNMHQQFYQQQQMQQQFQMMRDAQTGSLFKYRNGEGKLTDGVQAGGKTIKNGELIKSSESIDVANGSSQLCKINKEKSEGTRTGKIKSDKYMVLQMGQSKDERQDQELIQYLSQNALAIQHHPGAVQFQVSKQMLATLKKKFGNMKAILPYKENPFQSDKNNNKKSVDHGSRQSGIQSHQTQVQSQNMKLTNQNQCCPSSANLQNANNQINSDVGSQNNKQQNGGNINGRLPVNQKSLEKANGEATSSLFRHSGQSSQINHNTNIQGGKGQSNSFQNSAIQHHSQLSNRISQQINNTNFVGMRSTQYVGNQGTIQSNNTTGQSETVTNEPINDSRSYSYINKIQKNVQSRRNLERTLHSRERLLKSRETRSSQNNQNYENNLNMGQDNLEVSEQLKMGSINNAYMNMSNNKNSLNNTIKANSTTTRS